MRMGVLGVQDGELGTEGPLRSVWRDVPGKKWCKVKCHSGENGFSPFSRFQSLNRISIEADNEKNLCATSVPVWEHARGPCRPAHTHTHWLEVCARGVCGSLWVSQTQTVPVVRKQSLSLVAVSVLYHSLSTPSTQLHVGIGLHTGSSLQDNSCVYSIHTDLVCLVGTRRFYWQSPSTVDCKSAWKLSVAWRSRSLMWPMDKHFRYSQTNETGFPHLIQYPLPPDLAVSSWLI